MVKLSLHKIGLERGGYVYLKSSLSRSHRLFSVTNLLERFISWSSNDKGTMKSKLERVCVFVCLGREGERKVESEATE